MELGQVDLVYEVVGCQLYQDLLGCLDLPDPWRFWEVRTAKTFLTTLRAGNCSFPPFSLPFSQFLITLEILLPPWSYAIQNGQISYGIEWVQRGHRLIQPVPTHLPVTLRKLLEMESSDLWVEDKRVLIEVFPRLRLNLHLGKVLLKGLLNLC